MIKKNMKIILMNTKMKMMKKILKLNKIKMAVKEIVKLILYKGIIRMKLNNRNNYLNNKQIKVKELRKQHQDWIKRVNNQ